MFKCGSYANTPETPKGNSSFTQQKRSLAKCPLMDKWIAQALQLCSLKVTKKMQRGAAVEVFQLFLLANLSSTTQ